MAHGVYSLKIFTCECGKTFIPTPEWLYKLRRKQNSKAMYYCSYTCWRKAGGDSGKYTKYVRHKKVL